MNAHGRWCSFLLARIPMGDGVLSLFQTKMYKHRVSLGARSSIPHFGGGIPLSPLPGDVPLPRSFFEKEKESQASDLLCLGGSALFFRKESSQIMSVKHLLFFLVVISRLLLLQRKKMKQNKHQAPFSHGLWCYLSRVRRWYLWWWLSLVLQWVEVVVAVAHFVGGGLCCASPCSSCGGRFDPERVASLKSCQKLHMP